MLIIAYLSESSIRLDETKRDKSQHRIQLLRFLLPALWHGNFEAISDRLRHLKMTHLLFTRIVTHDSMTRFFDRKHYCM